MPQKPNFLLSFFSIRKSLKAKIFVSLLITTLTLVSAVTFFWYQNSLAAVEKTILENMQDNLDVAQTQLTNIVHDVRHMHAIIVSEKKNLQYMQNLNYNLPDANWFVDYYQVLLNLEMMKAGLDRSISGIAIVKSNGEVCLTGTLSFNVYASQPLSVQGFLSETDTAFYLPRESTFFDTSHYLYIGRQVQLGGKQQASLITKLSDNVLDQALQYSSYENGFVLALSEDKSIVYDSTAPLAQAAKEQVLTSIQAGAEIPQALSNQYYFKQSYVEGANLLLIMAVPRAFFQHLSKHLTLQLVFIMVAATLLAAVIAVLISNKITRGIAVLAADMRKVAGGTMAGLSQPASNDEIGQLSRNFLHMISDIKALMQDIKDKEKEKMLMEMKILRAQISPHFLYNSLNTIKYLAVMQKADNINELTSAIIDLLQGAIAVDDILVSLTNELRFVKNYISIQQYRFPHGFDVHYSIEPAAEQLLVPKMILQPIVENAIIHGLANRKTDGSIRIKANLYSEKLLISVTDNGIGMTQEQINAVMAKEKNISRIRFSGIGISNVDQRIKLQLGPDYGVFIYSQPQVYTTIEITLPIIQQQADPLKAD